MYTRWYGVTQKLRIASIVVPFALVFLATLLARPGGSWESQALNLGGVAGLILLGAIPYSGFGLVRSALVWSRWAALGIGFSFLLPFYGC